MIEGGGQYRNQCITCESQHNLLAGDPVESLDQTDPPGRLIEHRLGLLGELTCRVSSLVMHDARPSAHPDAAANPFRQHRE